MKRWSFPIFCGFTLLLAAGRVGAWQMKQAPLMTQWASQIDTNNPLPEYPRPQMVRTNWLNLNGIWQFQAGATNDPAPTNQTLSGQILVPYPMESAISGVMQYHEFSWYRRTFTVPPAWNGQRIILHLDAVNWESAVYINGQSAGDHKGGYDPFSYDITPYLNGATNEIIVGVYSPVDNAGEPRGKQTLYPGGIMYTSSSGIWQPAWLEPVAASGVNNLQIIPDVDNSRLRLTVNTYSTSGITVAATVLDGGTPLSTVTGAPGAELDVPIASPKLWSPDNPFLYGLQVVVIQGGNTNDSVASYFGMRKISTNIVNGVIKIFLNNQFYFGIGPLDQGFWPDGIYTAPTDEALKSDLEQEKALGFNMVRKHIKVERQRWYYWADTLGLLVWQDMPSCNSYTSNTNPPPVAAAQFETELTRLIQNHWNSPAIIMWDIFNEGQGQETTAGGVGQATTASLVQLAKTLDPSRLVNQASGGLYFGVGDVYDSHNYPAPGNPNSITQAVVDGEYGGIGFQLQGHLWDPPLAGGNYIGASTTNDIASIYDTFVNDLVNYKSNGSLSAAVYTQITDVENEENGLLTYDRFMKADSFRIKVSNQKAITGQLSLATVLPTSQPQAQTWKYTTATPATNWTATNFNDTSWSSGPAGFGTAGTPGAVVGTTWNTADIWIRRQFSLGNLTAADLNNLVFNCYHDENCEIYINGVLAGSATGFASSYVLLTMTPASQSALVPNGANLIAVHCHNTTGGQDIDAGISEQIIVANTLTVPADYVGYWNLNETSGTTAADASGNGNNGTVNGAAWNANGKNNGCLSFNGVNNYVQINRTISNDFSIAFWVKTTQTGATGQWSQGQGLVDGYAGGGANDFGTALCGPKFGFGAGNPDTTIQSLTSINDGAWHHCVATRVAATGTMSVYVDGNLEATGTGGAQALTASTYLRFGSIQTGAGYFNGSLDEVKIYGRALGSNEVTALYDNSASLSAAPTGLAATPGNEQVALSWAESLWATSYQVGRATSSGGPYTIIGNSTTTSFVDTNVINGTTYYYVVAAFNSAGVSANSSEISATPLVLMAWFKADAITGLGNGAALATWTDASGNGNNATQPTVGQQPIYVTGAINGLPVVRFNSTNSTCLSLNRVVQDDFTIICVYQNSQGIGAGTAFFQGAGLVNGEVGGVQNDFGTSLNANGQILAGTGNPDTTVASGSGFNGVKPHIFTFKRTEATGTIALYVDGTLAGSATGGVQPLTSPGRLVLGAQQTLLNYLTGDIAEVKIFSAPLSDSDRTAEENALKCKYGLAGGAVPAAPTGLTATAGRQQVTLNWSPTAGAGSYNLWRSTNGGGNYALIASGIATNNYVDVNAVAGMTNYYEVAAVDGCGVGITTTANVLLAANSGGLNTLSASLAGGQSVLGFTGVSGDKYALDWTHTLAPPVTWIALNTNPAGGTGMLNFTNAPSGGMDFYRVRQVP